MDNATFNRARATQVGVDDEQSDFDARDEVLARRADRQPAPAAPMPETVVDPVAEAAAPIVETAPPAPPAPPRRSRLRPLLFALLPVALIAGGYYYVTGGAVMSTDNAYVQADTVGVATDVSGTVLSIDVHENEVVKKGQILFRLDPQTFQIALDGAQAQLGAVRSQVMTLHANYDLAQVQIQQAETDLPFYETQFQRQQNLLKSGAGTRVSFDQAQHDFQSAQQKVAVAKAQAAAALAQLNGDANQLIEKNAFYMQSASAVEDAQRNLNDTVVRAQYDGVVTNVNSLQIGSYLKASQPGFNLVSNQNLWVQASPKETELTYVRPGQAATVTIDTYPGVEWTGRVESIDPASASSFSLLPAQNTTGNWVKVVQRIPMRVRFDDLSNKPVLRVGMSATVEVDTGHANGLPTFLTQWFGGARHG